MAVTHFLGVFGFSSYAESELTDRESTAPAAERSRCWEHARTTVPTAVYGRRRYFNPDTSRHSQCPSDINRRIKTASVTVVGWCMRCRDAGHCCVLVQCQVMHRFEKAKISNMFGKRVSCASPLAIRI